MKIQVKLEQEKMTERQVRDAMEKAAAMARTVSAQRGQGDALTQDAARRLMEQNAEKDKKDGKI